jgi:hypothetical protein
MIKIEKVTVVQTHYYNSVQKFSLVLVSDVSQFVFQELKQKIPVNNYKGMTLYGLKVLMKSND